LPHDRPVDNEIPVYREVTECPDMPPGNVRMAVSQRLRERAGDLAQREQPVKNGIPQYPVFIP
jgi:hypothetical protein